MDLETRQVAAFVGKLTLRIREILDKTKVEQFEICRGEPRVDSYPHWMSLAEPMDCTSAALVAQELNQAFWFEAHHHHGDVRRTGDTELRTPMQGLYLAWKGLPYPGSGGPHHSK